LKILVFAERTTIDFNLSFWIGTSMSATKSKNHFIQCGRWATLLAKSSCVSHQKFYNQTFTCHNSNSPIYRVLVIFFCKFWEYQIFRTTSLLMVGECKNKRNFQDISRKIKISQKKCWSENTKTLFIYCPVTTYNHVWPLTANWDCSSIGVKEVNISYYIKTLRNSFI
jgi:hypothetical protein